MNDQKQKIFTLDEATLSRYISNKIYYAKPMKRGEYCENRGWDVPDNENPDDDGYVILYPDGYISWNLKSNFEGTSSRTDHMNFGMAIAVMKLGKKVARDGWNGKDMFVYLQEGSNVSAEEVRNAALRGFAEINDGRVTILPHLDMKAADGNIVIGWLASQTDMLSDDWFIVE